jgi:hypothetical protein
MAIRECEVGPAVMSIGGIIHQPVGLGRRRRWTIASHVDEETRVVDAVFTFVDEDENRAGDGSIMCAVGRALMEVRRSGVRAKLGMQNGDPVGNVRPLRIKG